GWVTNAIPHQQLWSPHPQIWSLHPQIWLPSFKLTLLFPFPKPKLLFPLLFPLREPRFAFPLQFPFKLPLLKFPFPFQQLAALTVAVTDAIKKTTNKILSVLFVLLNI